MNSSDPFEQRLRQQPIRQIPREWKEELLSQARGAGSASTPSRPWHNISLLVELWSELVWRPRRVWTGIAAAWAILLTVNLLLIDPVKPSRAESRIPPSTLMLTLDRQERLVTEWILDTEPQAFHRPKQTVPRPQSQKSSTWMNT